MRPHYADFGLCRCCVFKYICSKSICKTIRQAFVGWKEMSADDYIALNQLTKLREYKDRVKLW